MASDEVALLDRVVLTPAEIPHPVDLLTVEQAATHADVPLSTVDSAVSCAAEFRCLVLEQSIRTLSTSPGPRVWAALQKTVDANGSELHLGPIVAARAQELADDPALPLFLTGFGRLDDPGIRLAVNDVLCQLVAELWPFIRTAYAAFAEPCPLVPTADSEFAGLLYLLSDALRRLVFPAKDPDEEDRVSAVVASLMRQAMDAELKPSGAVLFPDVDDMHPRKVRGVAADAVAAGVELQRTGAILPATTLSVVEAARRCDISVSSFYRRFGSRSEFERRLFLRSEHVLVEVFGIDHHRQILDDLKQEVATRQSDTSPADGMAYFVHTVFQRVSSHVAAGRPGTEALPWLNSPVLAPVIRHSFRNLFEERGAFLDKVLEYTRHRSGIAVEGADLAAILGTVAMILEGLIRNSPQPAASAAALGPQLSSFINHVFVPVDT